MILLDIGLPNLNGIEVAKLLQEIELQAKVLFVSQNHDLEVIRAAWASEPGGYVLKADAASELLNATEAVLRGDKYLSSRFDKDSLKER